MRHKANISLKLNIRIKHITKGLSAMIKNRYVLILSLLTIISLLVPQTYCRIGIFNNNDDAPRIIEKYTVPTKDNSSITLTRYYHEDKSPIIFIHGMGCNHKIYDFDEEHSLARYLNDRDWDVWLLDLRTHDGDGDFSHAIGSDREYIDRYWDFDNHLLKIDVVTAIDFIKEKTDSNKVFLSGHSYGGYLAYAYSMLIGEKNLSGIITTGASPYANPQIFQDLYKNKMYDYGYYQGDYAYVDPNGKADTHSNTPRLYFVFYSIIWRFLDHSSSPLFYKETTPYYIQKRCFFIKDDESAGTYVDMFFGGNPEKYNGDWVDPQTLYNYSKNLSKITVPILFIAGDEDPQDPKEDIYRAYENVSSENKEFYSFEGFSHMDLLMGDNADELIFPKIHNFMTLYGN